MREKALKLDKPLRLKFDGSAMKITVVCVGLLIGGVVGFLLRPTVPFMGQLPFNTVITRGANLHGLDQLLVGYARTSFNYLIAGTIAGRCDRTDWGFRYTEPKLRPSRIASIVVLTYVGETHRLIILKAWFFTAIR